MEGSSSQPFDHGQTAPGASKFLSNLPLMATPLYHRHLLQSGGLRVYICEHSTSPPEGLSSSATYKDYHSLTVERLRALLKERGLSPKGKKDELIARLKCVNESARELDRCSSNRCGLKREELEL
ncbi:uncharacterized protein LOC120192009 [Hibiscus syriacus]|uniref:uncharacterized protein LOC120192009 n=1 Tax=Hibiscus syriacus TaxID=106335 RepID=UPI0019241E45|nr:uncharacterized protein LOC120192009 [Hibiscus syriacus]